MNVQTKTDHIAEAEVCIEEADRLCYEDPTDETAASRSGFRWVMTSPPPAEYAGGARQAERDS